MIRRLILLPRAAAPCLRPTFFASCLGLILLCAPPLLAKDARWEKHLPFWPACNRWSEPGSSFYGVEPWEAVPLDAEMKAAHRQRRASAKCWWGGANAADWEDHFRQTLSFHDCRFICVHNWNLAMFEQTTVGQQAVRKLVAQWRE